ncbi:MAG: ARC6/PARC6 family protein [Phormidium sp. BM_Day4_Bin.17]|nr:ARC6/PARC6 family protein [Phormidium sp. BM_Day4_Bin.17]UCJ11479.1 MAG: DUF4101 domain-containing protein [Phormidium sp. PBR-2020]
MNQSQYLSQWGITLMIFGLFGCDGPSPESPSPSVEESVIVPSSPVDCSVRSQGGLGNPQPLDFSELTVRKQGTITAEEDLVFVFQGEQGDRLSYEYDEEQLCLWVYAPNNDRISEGELTRTGQYMIQVSSRYPQGTYDLEIDLRNPILLTRQEEERVLQAINNYLEAKPQLFGPSLDRDAAVEVLTGDQYDKAMGSIQWLKRYRGYYDYHISKIDDSKNFQLEGNRAKIDVTITEHLTLYIKGEVDRSNSTASPNTNDYRIRLEKINRNWKISNIDSL